MSAAAASLGQVHVLALLIGAQQQCTVRGSCAERMLTIYQKLACRGMIGSSDLICMRLHCIPQMPSPFFWHRKDKT